MFEPKIPTFAGIERRAAALLLYIRELFATKRLKPDAKLNLVAHSLGGLDARWLITHLEGHRCVASLTTIATPVRVVVPAPVSVADSGNVSIGGRP